MSGLVVAVLTVVTLLFLTGLFENLPEATLAAVVIAAVDRARRHRRAARLLRRSTRRSSARIYGTAARPTSSPPSAAMLGVLIFDTLPGLVIGIIVSLMLLLYRASEPHVAELGHVVRVAPTSTAIVDRHPDNEADPRPSPCCASSPGCSSPTPTPVRDAIRHHAGRARRRVGVVLDAEAIAFVDITAVRMLDELGRRPGTATVSSS